MTPWRICEVVDDRQKATAGVWTSLSVDVAVKLAPKHSKKEGYERPFGLTTIFWHAMERVPTHCSARAGA